MYQIKDSILYKDGKKTFALGESYYPSFHPCKFPVKPEDDRIGEMKKDLKMMAEAGFNHVRFAALGDVSYDPDSNTVSLDSPLVDAMTEEAEKNDLSVSIRLQGYSVNLRGFKDGGMIDENGREPKYIWASFIRTTLKHQGILEDNFVHGRDLAKHFSKYENVVGYQIYNEPHFTLPNQCVCDYNPHTIRAFRKWLVEKNVLTESEAQNYEPPHGRKDQTARMWALWRVFSTETLTDFLNNASRGAKNGADLPTFTCFTTSIACKSNSRLGEDAFANAKEMDLVGYTTYKHAWGAEYYYMCLNGDIFQCAAEAEGKDAWCIELDSRTYIPLPVYNKGTYATIGSGVKGIVYYQWRGDCPVPGVPHPNSCGILNYDGTKTANFDNAVQVNRYIKSINDLLVNAHRPQEGIGLLHSLYSLCLYDAKENDDYQPENFNFYNSWVVYFQQLYKDLRKTGYTVTITDAEHLLSGKNKIRVLVVADVQSLSTEEKDILHQFMAQGGTVYTSNEIGTREVAYPGLRLYEKKEYTYEERAYRHHYSTDDLPDLTRIAPIARAEVPNLGTQVLQGEDYTLVVLTNLSPVKDTIDAKIRISIPFTSAEFTSIDNAGSMSVNGSEITVKDMTDGGILILR